LQVEQSVDRAVILAAGLGTRLKWMTRHKPKALMSIQGQPAIAHVIRKLVGQGVRNIVINVHHHADALMEYVGNGERWGANIVFSQESELLDSGGGVRTGLEKLPGQGLILVHNADVLADIDVQGLARCCPDDGCALALVDNPVHHPKGDFAIKHGQVLLQGEQRYTFAGVSLWHDSVLHGYAKNTAFPLLDVIKYTMEKQRCAGLLHGGQWFDIGRPKDIVRANREWHI